MSTDNAWSYIRTSNTWRLLLLTLTKLSREAYTWEYCNSFFSVSGQIVCVRIRLSCLQGFCLSKPMRNASECAVMWKCLFGCCPWQKLRNSAITSRCTACEMQIRKFRPNERIYNNTLLAGKQTAPQISVANSSWGASLKFFKKVSI